MTIDELIKMQTLKEWCNQFGWQGGTIHQVENELRRILANKGYFEDKETKEFDIISIGNKRIVFV